MNVTVTLEDVVTVRNEGSVVVITGTNERGQRVTFAGDHRPMGAMIDALIADREDDEAQVEVDSWQILSIREAGE